MNFPLENPLFRLLYWLINTAGIGGVIILVIAGGLVTTFILVMLWVTAGSYVDEPDIYTYPTHSLLEE